MKRTEDTPMKKEQTAPEQKRINVTRSSMPSLDEYTKEIAPLWESRWLSNNGSLEEKLESDLKEYLGCDNICLFANGHNALETCLSYLPAGSEVITTAYTFVSTTHAIIRCGLTPVFADVEENYLTLSPDSLESAINEKTSAIVATHVYGFLCDVKRIEEIAKKYNLKVIYDAAHAFGVTIDGVGAATFGDAAMFSTHATKVFHTAEGGIVSYRDKKFFGTMKEHINFGFTSQEEVGYIATNARMNELEAAMGLCNLRHIDEYIRQRKAAYERYEERLSDTAGIRLLKPDKHLEWNYGYCPVLFDGYRYSRDEIKSMLEKENIFARKYFYPTTNRFACYREKYGNLYLPVSVHASETVLTLPLYSELTKEDVDRICDIILK